MKTHPSIRSIVAAVVALSIAGSGSAWAGKKDDRHGYGHGGHYGKHYSYAKPGKHKGHRYRDGYRHPYNRGYGSSTYYYRRDDGDSDEKLLIGLLVGGLLGYAVTNSQADEPYRYESYPPAGALPQGGPATCLQEREYQMTVIVGGREVEAYGTACLQPDGSWSRGPAKVASY